MAITTEQRGEIAVLGQEGDTRVSWSRDNDDEIQAARAMFDNLTRKGYIAYKAEGKDDRRGERVRTFDPAAERIILVPQLQGG